VSEHPRTTPARQTTGGSGSRAADPLPTLVFLLPLILLYEAGSAIWLTDPATGGLHETIRAHRLFSRLFEAFGVGGAMLPGVALIAVLLVWQVISKRPWRLRPATIGLMALESAAWTLPLLVFGQMVWLAGADAVADRPLGARLTIAVGAGLYEEALFRMVAIAALHFLLVDLIQLSQRVGLWASVALAALAFAVYHDDWSARFVFLSLAGGYFGAIYVTRGLGIVVGAHALYDIIVLTV